MSHESEDMLLTNGAGRELGLTPDGVRYLERTGRLQAIRVNGVRVFRRVDVEALKRQRAQRRPSTTAA